MDVEGEQLQQPERGVGERGAAEAEWIVVANGDQGRQSDPEQERADRARGERGQRPGPDVAGGPGCHQEKDAGGEHHNPFDDQHPAEQPRQSLPPASVLTGSAPLLDQRPSEQHRHQGVGDHPEDAEQAVQVEPVDVDQRDERAAAARSPRPDTTAGRARAQVV